MIKSLFITVVAMVVLAGCSGAPASSWCYMYDFHAGAYGATILQGSWNAGVGFSSADDGNFSIEFTHTNNVTPSSIRVFMGRGKNVIVPIDISVQANIFGIMIGPVNTQFPARIEQDYVATVTNPTNENGASVSIKGWASETVRLRGLEVQGSGANPFGTSNCATRDAGPSPIDIPAGELIDALQEADASAGGTGGQLTSPEGAPLLPNINAPLLFGYAKWLISGAAIQQMTGPFATILTHLALFVGVQMALSAVYGAFYVATYLARWVVWIFRLILQILTAIVGIIDLLGGKLIGWALKFIGA